MLSKVGHTAASIVLLLWSAHILANELIGKVVSAADGDAIKVLNASMTEYKIRLSGIDAPERGQPYVTVSRDHLASLVASKEVMVE